MLTSSCSDITETKTVYGNKSIQMTTGHIPIPGKLFSPLNKKH